MRHGLDPGVVPERMAYDLDAFLTSRAVSTSAPEDGCQSFRLSGYGGAHGIADELPEGFMVRRECCALPDVVVWASDDERAIVLAEPVHRHEPDLGEEPELPALVFFAEIWTSEAGFHDRLDELAPVAA